MDNKPASSLVVSFGKALDASPFMWKAGGPDTSEMATPKRVRTSHPKNNDTMRFLVNGRKIWKNKIFKKVMRRN